MGLPFLYLADKKCFYNCVVKKFFLYNYKFFYKKVTKIYSNFGYTCSDYILYFMLINLYDGFYENCFYNGFYVDCFL